MDHKSQDLGGEDAVCFTSGPPGAPFAAGVIHAWLAADRKRPLVAAGISMGAISAAAMRRVYQEMDTATTQKQREQKRWEWFRRYLAAVTTDPLLALWNAIPDPADFFASLPPVKDGSVPDQLKESAEEARRHYFMLTKLGVWLANLPVRVSTVATLAVMHVRRKENYGDPLVRDTLFWWNCFKTGLGLVWHMLRQPSWIKEGTFSTAVRERTKLHPLFGWPLWILNIAAVVFVCALAYGYLKLTVWLAGALQIELTLLFLGFHLVAPIQLSQMPHFLTAIGSECVAALVVGALIYWTGNGLRLAWRWHRRLESGRPKRVGQRFASMTDWFLRRFVFGPLDMTQGVLHPYEAKRRLYELFCEGPAPSATDIHLIPVCAALQSTEQVLLRSNIDIVETLSAAVAIPGLFPPVKMSVGQMVKAPSGPQPKDGVYQLIDGAAVRANPIPAFFDWCKQPRNNTIARRIEDRSNRGPSLHVVYSVPIDYPGNVAEASMACPDIVESAIQALELAKRRDTRQEVRQTNFATELERVRRKALNKLGLAGTRGPFAILADEIAPKETLDIGNSLAPDRKELMRIVAQGCQAALEVLYSDQLKAVGASVGCHNFLKQLARERAATIPEFQPGLPEVCARCSGVLAYCSREKQNSPSLGVIPSYGSSATNSLSSSAKPQLADLFPHLAIESPKVVFLGSGGVFRGAFHIGVLAAMTEARLYPDLVIGASVGALMGGALCNITAGPQENETDVLVNLASVFLNVDDKVALTQTLKNAMKQLGTRARSIRLSPSELTRMVAKGSKADPGFAATGAPPALIDALSSLFVIPHRKTSEISSKFVAGHVSEACACFLSQLRKETLTSFGVQTAFIGVSMLSKHASELLGKGTAEVDLGAVQPYQGPAVRKRVSFFCTTSYLNSRTPLLLGRDFLTANPTWNGLYAGLCSSAFPVAFAPRQESDLLPGTGNPERYFADGGMFDNLPFFPAIEILSAMQRSRSRAGDSCKDVLNRVAARVASPSLFIAAGLNASPDLSAPCQTLFQIKERSAGLSVNNKTESFRYAAQKISRDLAGIAALQEEEVCSRLNERDLAFLDGAVPAKVISILPTDEDHLNPTFAFCKSMGLGKARVQRSIADGCYRSLQQFADPGNGIRSRTGSDAIESVSLVERKEKREVRKAGTTECPFYKKNGVAFTCPFTRSPLKPMRNQQDVREREQVFAIFGQCCDDATH